MAQPKEDQVVRKIRPFKWEIMVVKGKVIYYFHGLTYKSACKQRDNYFNSL